MVRFTRCLVAGAAGAALLIGPLPAFAGEPEGSASLGATHRAQPTTAADVDVPAPARSLDVGDLPVQARDVTTTDRDLRSTSREVTVLTSTVSGTPAVTKLRTHSAKDAKTLARALDARPGVVAARTKRLHTFAANPEPLAQKQTYLRTIGAATAWGWTQGAGVRVAVIDSGVDATHPDLAGRVATLIDLLPETAPRPVDTGHGTRVASIIAAARNHVGIAGVAPAATIVPIEALDPSGLGDTSTVARAIIAAVNAGARVVNLSLGGPDRDPVLDRACAYAFNRGVVVVAAGGNSYDDGNLPQYPAASPGVVGVASVDSRGSASLFANSGRYIDLAAPGENVVAAFPGGYNRGTGTSFAAPQVAGTFALMIAANPRLRPADLATIARRTAKDDPSKDGVDDEVGYGIVRADRAVQAAATLRRAPGLASAKARISRLNAAPEPLRKHRAATVTAVIQLHYPSGAWRHSPVPSLVRFQFKPKGKQAYRTVGVTGTAAGLAQLRYISAKSGRWRAQVLQGDGSWTASKTDYVRVRG